MAKEDVVKLYKETQGALNQALSNIAIKDSRIEELEEELRLAHARTDAAYAEREDMRMHLDKTCAEMAKKDALIAKLTERYIALEDARR